MGVYIVPLNPRKFPYGWSVISTVEKPNSGSINSPAMFPSKMRMRTWMLPLGRGKLFRLEKFSLATKKSEANTHNEKHILKKKKTRNSQIIGIPQVRPFTLYREVFFFFFQENLTFWVRLFLGLRSPGTLWLIQFHGLRFQYETVTFFLWTVVSM